MQCLWEAARTTGRQASFTWQCMRKPSGWALSAAAQEHWGTERVVCLGFSFQDPTVCLAADHFGYRCLGDVIQIKVTFPISGVNHLRPAFIPSFQNLTRSMATDTLFLPRKHFRALCLSQLFLIPLESQVYYHHSSGLNNVSDAEEHVWLWWVVIGLHTVMHMPSLSLSSHPSV